MILVDTNFIFLSYVHCGFIEIGLVKFEAHVLFIPVLLIIMIEFT